MEKQRKSSAEIAAELATAEARWKEISETIGRVEQQLKMLNDERKELHVNEYRGRGGLVPRLRGELEAAKRREQTARLPIVRVKPRWSEELEEWRYVKVTPKRIYLRRGDRARDEFWDLSGASSYSGTIHPEDLARILDGTIAKATGKP